MATVEEQLQLEREMYQLGADRHKFMYAKRQEQKMESLGHYGQAITEIGIEPLVEKIKTATEHIKAGKAGINYSCLQPLLQLAPEKIAAVAMRTCVDQLSSTVSFNVLANDLADKLWIETMLNRATEREMQYFLTIRGRRKRKKEDIFRMQNTTQWTGKERITTGSWLVLRVIECTGIIRIESERTQNKTINMIRPTDVVVSYIKDAIAAGQLLCPFSLPMIIPPRPWDKDLEGGYYSYVINSQLVKDYVSEIAEQITGDEPFIKAANQQQSVPWQINNWQLEHLQFAWDKGLEIGKLIPREGWSIPPYPKHLEETDPVVQKWRWEARHIHERNEKTITKRVVIAKMIWVANRFVQCEKIYFPMQLDFRGRYYYRPPFLNPQGNDIGRSLLQFADGKPISNESELNWLRVHGANVFGHSKLNLQQRIDWVVQNEQQIDSCGKNPWVHLEFWSKAKDPWQFLAFCHAYQQFLKHGFGYVCQLPVVLDCTCSGIQHYSALLRSESMGKLVNLVDTDQPADIYTTILLKVLDRLREDAQAGNQHAESWLQLNIDRTLLKPIVMTVPYSAGRSSHITQVQSWAYERTTELYGNTKSWRFKKGALKAIHYLTTIVVRETDQVIGPAKSAMQWFKFVGRLAGKSGTLLKWVTPSGLPVFHKYTDNASERIELRYLTDVRIRVHAYIGELSWRISRMGTALSPNVIHSLDASHMAFTTIDAFANGVTNLGGIHDCFATTPAEMATLRDSVRNSFSNLYSSNVYENITAQLVSQIPKEVADKVPLRPSLGTLDTNSVRNSTYFIT
jgi:DNA-directed RNA polymerase